MPFFLARYSKSPYLMFVALLLIIVPGVIMGVFDKQTITDIDADITGGFGGGVSDFLHATSFFWVALGIGLIVFRVFSSPVAVLVAMAGVSIIILMWEGMA